MENTGGIFGKAGDALLRISGMIFLALDMFDCYRWVTQSGKSGKSWGLRVCGS